MAITKIKDSDYANKGIRVKNNPLGLSVAEAQRAFDELSLDVIIPAVNRMAGEIDTTVSELQNKDTTNSTAIAKNTADISTNKSDISKNKTDISQNKTDITDIKGKVSALQIDISQKAEKDNVLSKDNTEIFVPAENYNPATKKYVDDLVSTSGGGDMLKAVYDKQNKGLDIYEYADKHIDNKNNPHNVTAKQLGALTNESLTKETILNKIDVLDIEHGGTGNSTIQEVNNAFEWSNPNLLINGDFQVWQRGDRFTGIGKIFTADRWFIPFINNDSGNKVEKVKNTSECSSMYAMRLTRQNTSGKVQIYQPIENYSMYEGKKLTISFYVRAVGTPKFIGYRVGQNQNGGLTPTTSWQRVSKTVEAAHFTADTSCGGFLIYTTGDGLFSANSGIEITGLKVELGGVATPFITRTYQEELALCQRYFYNPLYLAGGYPYLTELCTTTNGGAFRIQFPVPMRILPTLLGDFSNLYIKNNVGSTTAITAIKRGDGTNVTVGATATTAGTFTANQFYYLQYRGTSPNYTSILFDAEIY